MVEEMAHSYKSQTKQIVKEISSIHEPRVTSGDPPPWSQRYSTISIVLHRKAIPSDESLQQGRNRARELDISLNKPNLAATGTAHSLPFPLTPAKHSAKL